VARVAPAARQVAQFEVDLAQRLEESGLADADRELLGDTLRSLRRAICERGGEQLPHGEPHPGNVLTTKNGLVFIDLETRCRGPIEFDLAHAPEEAASTIGVPIKTCWVGAESWCWR
jgi:thiamine kinase-like enzyme